MPVAKTSINSRLRGRTALVTGASRGIGFAIARALAQDGASLIITARDEDALDTAQRELERAGAKVFARACDVSDSYSVDLLFADIRATFKKLDVLVNNAGISPRICNIRDLPYSTWKQVLATNLDGLFLVTQSALKLMKRGGVIVNNLSVAATQAFAGSAAYNSSKHGGLGFTNTLREEVREQGIRVIALLPGPTDTEIWNTYWPDAPRRKMMSPETVAQAALNAILLPENTTVEELKILPTAGTL
ncbi:MAG TPA: SDR family oxidoreductase [Terriglobales bacterium]|nr:SDR family oxidoreductase [Terriglobales bacterium]